MRGDPASYSFTFSLLHSYKILALILLLTGPCPKLEFNPRNTVDLRKI